MSDFGKLLTAVITPFDSNGVLSTDTLWRLCRKLVHEKSDGLVLSGTTGESPNLTKEDRKIIYSTAKDSVGDKAKIIAGTGTYSTRESIEYTKMANDLGVDGIMIVTPYYSKPSQFGILQHFEQISKNTDLPIMAYNIPGRTATLIELDTLEKLADEIGIHSIKDAVGDLNFSKTELEVLKDKVDIYSGNDGETIEFMKMGGKGVVSVASHVVGNEIFNLINHVLNDEIDSAEQLQTQLLPFFDLLFEEPSPGPVKYLLTETWEDVGSPLMPITNVSGDLASKLLENFQKIKNN
jgi:4-hydroxy-tetrahydrodipicolinate synthase